MADPSVSGRPAAAQSLGRSNVGGAAIWAAELTYAYPGRRIPAVDDLSFEVGEGEIFGLLGPSGAGKSTTQKILTRQQRRFEGRVEVLGKPIGRWGPEYFEEIGVGFELPNHYLKFSALENLEFFASLYRRRGRDPLELLAMVGLERAAHTRVEELSKGMRMRLNFVRAVQHEPRLIFLDEPTAGLDPVNAGIIKSIIADLRRAGKTIVLTTHNMNDVDELCDRVSFMVGGGLAVIDTPEALKDRYGRQTVRVTHGDGRLETEEFPLEALGDNRRFVDILRAGRIRKIHSQEATLDRVFKDVTGHSLDGGGSGR